MEPSQKISLIQDTRECVRDLLAGAISSEVASTQIAHALRTIPEPVFIPQSKHRDALTEEEPSSDQAPLETQLSKAVQWQQQVAEHSKRTSSLLHNSLPKSLLSFPDVRCSHKGKRRKVTEKNSTTSINTLLDKTISEALTNLEGFSITQPPDKGIIWLRLERIFEAGLLFRTFQGTLLLDKVNVQPVRAHADSASTDISKLSPPLFQQIAHQILAAALYFLSPDLSEESTDTPKSPGMNKLMEWIYEYRTLFTCQCAVCGKILSWDPEWQHFFPPVKRSPSAFLKGDSTAYHIFCAPKGT